MADHAGRPSNLATLGRAQRQVVVVATRRQPVLPWSRHARRGGETAHRLSRRSAECPHLRPGRFAWRGPARRPRLRLLGEFRRQRRLLLPQRQEPAPDDAADLVLLQLREHPWTDLSDQANHRPHLDRHRQERQPGLLLASHRRQGYGCALDQRGAGGGDGAV